MKETGVFRTWESRVAVLLLLACFVGQILSAQSQSRGLSLVQITKLIQVHTPDDIVAQEIHSRGLDFIPTPRILDELQQHGAGQQSLAAVRERMPIGTLEIQTVPSSHISLDGTDRGEADAQGRLVLQDLPEGPHMLSVTKTGYQPANFKLTLSAREYKRFATQLDWGGGFLTVRSTPPGTSVVVAGIGQFRDDVADLPCLPGTYEVSVAHTGMKTETRSVAIAAGQHAAVEFHLALDPAYLQKRLSDAKQRLAQGDTQGAIQVASELSSLAPKNPEIDSLFAASYWKAGDLKRFQSSAENALSEGGSVTASLAHEHLGLTGEAIHGATITITSKSLAYDPQGSRWKYHAFAEPMSNVETVEATDNAMAGSFVVRHLAQGTFLLHLEIRSSADPGKKVTLFFALSDSQIQQRNNIGFLVSANNSSQFLRTLADVIKSAKTPAGTL